MNLSIAIYPDKILKQKSEDIEKFDDELHQLLDSMYPLMMNTNGIGLAAIQVAIAKKVQPGQSAEWEALADRAADDPEAMKLLIENSTSAGAGVYAGAYAGTYT